MKIIFNKNQFPFWPLGINQRLFFLNAICHKFKLNPEIHFYDNNKQNRFYDLFEINLPEFYSKESSIVVNNKKETEIIDKNIFWLVDHNREKINGSIAGDTVSYLDYFKNTIKLSKNIIEESKQIYAKMGSPTVGLIIRETEKFDSTPTIASALPSRLIYDKLVELNLHKEKILIVSDSLLTIDYLRQKKLDIVYYSKFKSGTIFPSHWFSKISRFYPENSGEYKLFDNVEYEMARDFLIEISILTQCSIEHKYSTILSGPTILANLLSENPIKNLIDVEKDLTERELDIVRFHQSRECILWKTLMSYAEQNGEYKY
jgi:hypothetical protein